MQDAPDEMVALNTYANEFIAGVVTAKLEDSGIPAKSITSNHALIGAFGQTGWFPFTVWVRKADQERARAVLEAVRAEQGTVDWDAVDVGDPEPGDAAAVEAAGDPKPRKSKHARIGLAGGLLIAAVICWEVAPYPGGPAGTIGVLLQLVGFVCLLWAVTLAFGVLFMSRTERK